MKIMMTSCANAVVKQGLLCGALVGAALMTAAPAVSAEDHVAVLMRKSLADVPGKVATVLTVDYTPGAASDPHVHPGSVFAYVLEGAVVAQLDGEQPVTYRKGQSWYEPPKRPHLVSKNGSQTEPAKLLVFLLSQEGEPTKTPVTLPDGGR